MAVRVILDVVNPKSSILHPEAGVICQFKGLAISAITTTVMCYFYTEKYLKLQYSLLTQPKEQTQLTLYIC